MLLGTMKICILFVLGLCTTSAERRFVLGPATQYRVTVATADEKSAGTNAHVFISMSGDHGITREIELNPDKSHHFDKGMVDQFLVAGASVGNLTSIRIRHDTAHHDASWKLEKVTIEDGEGIYEFACDCWLDKRHNDGTLSQMIPLSAYQAISSGSM